MFLRTYTLQKDVIKNETKLRIDPRMRNHQMMQLLVGELSVMDKDLVRVVPLK